MPENNMIADLKAFALQALDAEKYPRDIHTFRLFTCDSCGHSHFTPSIEHHTGSKKGDFKGIIRGTCAQCGAEQQLFSFTGAHRQFLRSENPRCTCGHRTFITGECERIEGDEGLPGFFDEGVIVGACARCGKHHLFAGTD